MLVSATKFSTQDFNGIVEIANVHDGIYKPLCQKNVNIDVANLYCQNLYETNAKTIHQNQSCANSQLSQSYQPLEFGIIINSPLEYPRDCYERTNKAFEGRLSDFKSCLYANDAKLSYDQYTDECNDQSCVAIECYSQTEYKNKIEQDAPVMTDHSLMIDEGLLLYYSINQGYSYVCEESIDLEDQFDKNKTDLMCQNMGFDYLESWEYVPCNYQKHYYATAKKVSIHCGCVCDDFFEECNASYQRDNKCSGIDGNRNENCMKVVCKNNPLSTTALVLIIVGSSILFIIIIICIIYRSCCKSEPQKKKKQQQINNVKPQQNKPKNKNKNTFGKQQSLDLDKVFSYTEEQNEQNIDENKNKKNNQQKKQKKGKQNQGIYVQAAKKIKQKKQNNNQHPIPSYQMDNQQIHSNVQIDIQQQPMITQNNNNNFNNNVFVDPNQNLNQNNMYQLNPVNPMLAQSNQQFYQQQGLYDNVQQSGVQVLQPQPQQEPQLYQLPQQVFPINPMEQPQPNNNIYQINSNLFQNPTSYEQQQYQQQQ